MTVVWEDEGGGGDFRVYWWCVISGVLLVVCDGVDDGRKSVARGSLSEGLVVISLFVC